MNQTTYLASDQRLNVSLIYQQKWYILHCIENQFIKIVIYVHVYPFHCLLPVYPSTFCLLPMCAHNSHCHLSQLFPFVVHVNSVFKFATASQTITFIKRKITFIKVFVWKKRYFGIIATHDTYCYCVFKFTFPPKTVFLWC